VDSPKLCSNGRYWQARWTDSTGKRRSVSLGPKAEMSRADALRRCRTLDTTGSPASGYLCVGQGVAEYLRLREGEVEDRVLANFRRVLNHLSAFVGPQTRAEAVTPMALAEWKRAVAGLTVRRRGVDVPVSPNTVHNFVRFARQWWRFMADLGQFPERNPFDRIRSAKARIAKDWRQVTNTDLLKLVDANQGPGWGCLWALCRWAGLRRGEALRLAWGDVDWKASTLRVVPPERNGRRLEDGKKRLRVCPVRPELLAILRRAFEDAPAGSAGPCDGVDRHNIDRLARAAIRRAGLPDYDRPFHTLRKCCATEWRAKYPAPTVSEWMGHTEQVADAFYVRSSEDQMRQVAGLVPSP